jgi:hypothetical protein
MSLTPAGGHATRTALPSLISFGAALAKFCSNVLSRWRGSSLSFWPGKTTVFTASGETRFGMLLEPAAAQAEDSPSDACCAVMASSSPSAT